MNFKKLKLSEYEQNLLTSVTVPRYIRETNKKAVEVWFEIFCEFLPRLGYSIYRADEEASVKHQQAQSANSDSLLSHALADIQWATRDGRSQVKTLSFNDFMIARLLELGYTLRLEGTFLIIDFAVNAEQLEAVAEQKEEGADGKE